MIQRIQTLFLLAAAIIQTVFLFVPLSNFFLESNNTILLYSYGYLDRDDSTVIFNTIPLLILCLIILLLTLVDIFLYKKRILQIRFCIYNILLNIGLVGLIAFYITNFMKNNPVIAHNYSVALAIPVASIILLFLSFRGIRKDELLIKAYERLR